MVSCKGRLTHFSPVLLYLSMEIFMPHSWKYSSFHVDLMVKLLMNREGTQDSAFCYVLESEVKSFWTAFSWLQYRAVFVNKRDSCIIAGSASELSEQAAWGILVFVAADQEPRLLFKGEHKQGQHRQS